MKKTLLLIILVTLGANTLKAQERDTTVVHCYNPGYFFYINKTNDTLNFIHYPKIVVHNI